MLMPACVCVCVWGGGGGEGGMGVYPYTNLPACMGVYALCIFACVCVDVWMGMCVCVCFKGFCYCLDLSMFRNIIIFSVKKYYINITEIGSKLEINQYFIEDVISVRCFILMSTSTRLI